MFRDKVILVTGGTGSIGSEIVRQLLLHSPKAVRVFSRDESKQFFMQQELREFDNIRYFVGDIRDKERLRYATQGVDYIFHAAALKHVPSCEYNPFEAVKTNVIGVQNIIEVALDNNVEKLISISTDKVVNPMNTMGATKLLSEKLISAANLYKGNRQTVFACVRFGNVMGSRGSVIPLFKYQIENNLPVTLTSREMTRFMMSIPQAAGLVLKAAKHAQGGEVFVLKMPTLNIQTLAEALIENYKEIVNADSNSRIEEIGVRPGEKLYEELMTREESIRALQNEEMYIIKPEFNENQIAYPGFKKADVGEYSSFGSKFLSKLEIMELLKKENLTFD